jgi:aspartate kinase
MLMSHGFLARVFAVFARYEIPIDLISTSEVSVSLTIDRTDHLAELTRELSEHGEVRVLSDVAIVSVVGRQFREQSGIAGRVFNTLSNLNILMISGGASDINLSFVVANEDADKAVRQLHAEFFGA